ncbi:hypothetical protein C8N38_109120 [Rhodovulum kholense]|uniref:Uncharacterized protein n=2 Tax=Rhodovulum kholense TaxID=453584 RepID=A0A8E2VJ64_9RHOB|nr:hypothetical protein C8N38_109120 [Rhodovulum kholense]
MVVNPGTPNERRLGNVDTAVLQPGDVLEIRSAGCGGRGDPMAREPWRVAWDEARGYVSAGAAGRDYGVVLPEGRVDEAATAALRARATPAAYDALSAILSALPIHWRFFAKTEIFARMDGRTGAEGVAAAFEAVCARFPDLPRSARATEAIEAAE